MFSRQNEEEHEHEDEDDEHEEHEDEEHEEDVKVGKSLYKHELLWRMEEGEEW